MFFYSNLLNSQTVVLFYNDKTPVFFLFPSPSSDRFGEKEWTTRWSPGTTTSSSGSGPTPIGRPTTLTPKRSWTSPTDTVS